MHIWIKLYKWGPGVRKRNKFKETDLFIFHAIGKIEKGQVNI